MILAIDTSTAACSAALFDASGGCVGSKDEIIARGHAERLMPMVAELLDGRRATRILVGVGPGSFTGIRVGIAAAQGLAIGWDSEICGMSSLALIAAGCDTSATVAAVVDGGHGELFVAEFGPGLDPVGDPVNLPPDKAAQTIKACLFAGPAAQRLLDARGTGTAIEAWPSAVNALTLPQALRSLPAKPVYARPPDAKVKSAA